MGLTQIPGLGSGVSLNVKQSAWLDLISWSSSFLCHSAHLPMLFRVCSPVPLKTIFTAMTSSNVFSKAKLGKSTWQDMHHSLLLGQNLYLGHCAHARTQESAPCSPQVTAGDQPPWLSQLQRALGQLCGWDVECLAPGTVSLCLCCDWAAGSFPHGGGS